MLSEGEFRELSQERKQSYIKSLKASRGKEDLIYLLREVLNYREVEDGVHGEIGELLERPWKKRLFLMPRGSFKTTVVTIGRTIQWILRDGDIRILLDSEVLDYSEKLLAQIKRDMRKSEFIELYGNMISSDYRETSREFTSTARKNLGLKEPTIYAAGIGTVNVGPHYDYIIADDLHSEKNVNTNEQIEKVIAHYRLLLSLLEPGGELVIVGCLPIDTKVLMANGEWKNIQGIKADEEVKSWDNNGIMNKRVEAVIPQGKADVYEIRTTNHKIQATANHPFLVGKEFIRLDKLKVGDKIIGLEFVSGGKDLINAEEAWALGFMFGDGWITKHPNSKGSMRWATCIAKSVYDDLNKKITGFFETRFSVKGYKPFVPRKSYKAYVPKKTDNTFKFVEKKEGYYRTEVARVGKWLESVGFKGKAKTKRIPEHIFSSSLKIRKAFMEGFVSADGYEDKHNRYYIEICNKELIEDFRRLLLMSGYKPSNVYSRIRENKAPHSKPGQMSESHHIGFSKFPKYKPKEFCEYEIKEIKKIGVKEVWDLTVADTHNFIAEGLVTHNTRWHFKDLYSYILEDECKSGEWEVMVRKAIADDGTLYFPRRLTREFLEAQRKSQGAYLYSVLYLNEPASNEDAIFKKENLRYWEGGEFPEQDGKRIFLNIYILIDRAFSSAESADYTGCICVGVSCSGTIYVLEAERHKFGLTQLLDLIFKWYDKYGSDRIRKVGIETINWEEIEPQVRDYMQKKNKFLVFERLLPEGKKSKDLRIRTALEARVANKLVYLKKHMVDLEDEFIRFPVGTHDDLCDALAYVVPFMTVPGSPTVERDDVEYESSGFFGNTGY